LLTSISLFGIALPVLLLLAVFRIASIPDTTWAVGVPLGLLAIAAGVSFWILWRSRWLARLGWRVRGFRTVHSGRIVVHHDPDLDCLLDMRAILQSCDAELQAMDEWFGRPLHGRAVVFLFAHYREIAAIDGSDVGGFALPMARAIVIANDCRPESLRHEFAHVFAARWNTAAPPLLSEGLAVWLQETEYGQPIDAVARRYLRDCSVTLTQLLDPRCFYRDPHRHACYAIAGSFTGFLVRRHGWERYQQMYRVPRGFRYRVRLEKCLGQTLEEAERQWRRELILMEVHERRLRGNIYR
jgi:hypothetical protein